jgi:hypothetical protein
MLLLLHNFNGGKYLWWIFSQLDIVSHTFTRDFAAAGSEPEMCIAAYMTNGAEFHIDCAQSKTGLHLRTIQPKSSIWRTWSEARPRKESLNCDYCPGSLTAKYLM